MTDKYRGTTTYVLVYAELATAACYQGLTTYQAIAQIMGLPMSGSHMAKETGRILDEINREDHGYGRPMLSALCVDVDGAPGEGFYVSARDLGRDPGDSRETKVAFWEAERAAVHAAWRRQFRSR